MTMMIRTTRKINSIGTVLFMNMSLNWRGIKLKNRDFRILIIYLATDF